MNTNMMSVNGRNSPVVEVELHLPLVDDLRMMFLLVSSDGEAGEFALWQYELCGLESLDDLDGKRIHIKPNGESYVDDTLGTDILGADCGTDMNYWSLPDGTTYSYGDILADFKCLTGNRYHIHVEMTLTESDKDMEDLLPEDYSMLGQADFEVDIDEKNPL